MILFITSCNDTNNKIDNKLNSKDFKKINVKPEFENNCNKNMRINHVNISFSNSWENYIIAKVNNEIIFSDTVVTNKSLGISEKNFTINRGKNDSTIVTFFIMNDKKSFSISIDYKYKNVKLYKNFDSNVIIRMTNCISLIY